MADDKKGERKGLTIKGVNVNPEVYYLLKMAMPHKVGRINYSPLYDYKVTGAVLSDIPANKIESITQL
jgi:hypothetical protein